MSYTPLLTFIYSPRGENNCWLSYSTLSMIFFSFYTVVKKHWTKLKSTFTLSLSNATSTPILSCSNSYWCLSLFWVFPYAVLYCVMLNDKDLPKGSWIVGAIWRWMTSKCLGDRAKLSKMPSPFLCNSQFLTIPNILPNQANELCKLRVNVLLEGLFKNSQTSILMFSTTMFNTVEQEKDSLSLIQHTDRKN